MSVDTYLKRKNLAPYRELMHDDVKILVAPSLQRWAESVYVGAKQFFIWRSFDIEVEHRHGPTCAH